MSRCILIGASLLDLNKIIVEADDYIIAVDAGMKYCKQAGLRPDLYIGDFDSLPDSFQDEVNKIERDFPQKVVRLNPEKDDTDMLAAFKEGIKKGFKEFVVYAATGGRLDHTLANLQCLLYLKRHGAEGMLIDAQSRVFVIENETIMLPSWSKGIISVFSLGNQAQGVSLDGLKYPLSDATITNDFPVGISNEFIGQDVKITVKNGALAIMILENIG